ncbi:hypothetical protein BHE74_00030234, partial [Ensete ventricosum]
MVRQDQGRLHRETLLRLQAFLLPHRLGTTATLWFLVPLLSRRWFVLVDLISVDFADQMDKARRLGSFKKFEVGRCSSATVSDAFKKHSAILQYLGAIDPSGEVQKLMGSTPLDLGRSNMAKSGQISRNALCPCGSGKRYKRSDF